MTLRTTVSVLLELAASSEAGHQDQIRTLLREAPLGPGDVTPHVCSLTLSCPSAGRQLQAEPMLHIKSGSESAQTMREDELLGVRGLGWNTDYMDHLALMVSPGQPHSSEQNREKTNFEDTSACSHWFLVLLEVLLW
ncbi:uncharacterized protein V6R79_009623 [Siganus canaliculatus]